jgi:hypothetical protein
LRCPVPSKGQLPCALLGVAVPAFAAFLFLCFVVYCILDVAMTDRASVRTLPKLVWLLLVLFIPVVGSVGWIVVGRPADAGIVPGSSRTSVEGISRGPVSRPDAAGGGGSATRPRSRPQPRGPDDDPQFLRKLEEDLRRHRHDDAGGDA